MKHPITRAEAKLRGLTQLTDPFVLPREKELLAGVVEDMIRSNVVWDYVTVEEIRKGGGYVYKQVEIWRSKNTKPRGVPADFQGQKAFRDLVPRAARTLEAAV